MRPISNLNSVLVKNYVPGSDTLAVLRELRKLGIIKSPKPKSKAKMQMIEDIKQPSDMVGYVKSLAGEPNRLSPNMFTLRQIEPGMSQQQIENIQRTNAAQVAALKGEITQHRSETQATIGGLVGAASQRFAQIGNVLGKIINPESERFRGSTFPAQASGIDPIDPFATRRPGVIYLGNNPETNDVPMDQTLNEGGPNASPEFATSTFPSEEITTINVPKSRIEAQKRIIKKITRNDFLQENGLGPLPPNTKTTTLQEMFEYYKEFCQIFGLDPNEELFSDKSGLYKDMVANIDDLINLSV
jgi:hypothetical protein